MNDLYDATGEKRWYVAHTYSGYENKVKTNLEKIVENRGLQDMIVDIRIPVETKKDVETGKEVEEKIYPSYVLVKMIMNRRDLARRQKHQRRYRLCRTRLKADGSHRRRGRRDGNRDKRG